MIVHNGIIENYRELRAELEASGAEIQSDTDTELIAHLIDDLVREGRDLLTAVREACMRLSRVHTRSPPSVRMNRICS